MINRIQILIIILFIFLQSIFCNANNNIKFFKDQKALFYFRYSPDKITEYKDDENQKGIVFTTYSGSINNFDTDLFAIDNRVDKNTALEEMKHLDKGELGNGYGLLNSKEMLELIKIDNKYGEINTILTYEDMNIYFKRSLIFFNNNRLVIINCLPVTEYEIVKSMPDFFNEMGWDFNSKKYKDPLLTFYRKLKSGKGSKIAQDWFDSIYEIIKTFRIFSGFYTPTVNNLRFRENQGLKGKFIRLLKKGEKLEVMEIGNEEKINGTQGVWVKVRTTKGEIGWYFDAYLKEVKNQ